jgi:hypothetical protein
LQQGKGTLGFQWDFPATKRGDIRVPSGTFLQQGEGALRFQRDFPATKKGDTRVRAVVVPNLHVGLSCNKERGH